jgi:ribosomal protein L21E
MRIADVALAFADDVISCSVRNKTWQDALKQMLLGYNYSAVWGKNGQPVKVTIYSRNQYSDERTVATTTAHIAVTEDMLIYESTSLVLPNKYEGLNPSSVMPVSLPVEMMKEMALGEKVSLNLPSGQYEVVHDNKFRNKQGDVTWIGYLENAGKAYRVIITMGNEGNIGRISTPDGTYNLDIEDGRNWLLGVAD